MNKHLIGYIVFVIICLVSQYYYLDGRLIFSDVPGYSLAVNFVVITWLYVMLFISYDGEIKDMDRDAQAAREITIAGKIYNRDG